MHTTSKLNDNFPRPSILFLLVALLAILVYLNSLPGSFFMDDVEIVARNPLVHTPDLLKILTSDYWGEQINSGLYRPLTIISFVVNRWILGSEPWCFHLVNVLLHAATSGLLGLALLACGFGAVVAWGSALLFAVHPLHTEVVNMAVGRSELLVGLLLFAALWLAQSGDTGRRRCAVAGCYGLALLAKEHAVVFLALLPAIDGFIARQTVDAWRRRTPLYLVLVAVTVAWWALRTWGVAHGDIPRDPYDPVYVPLATLPEAVRVLTALQLQLVYLGKLLLPLGQQGIYGGADFLRPVPGFFSARGLLVVIAVLAYGGGTLLLLRRRSLAGLALLLYAISFAPTANVLFVTGATFAERLTYLPSAWFCLGVVCGIDCLTHKLPRRLLLVITLVVFFGYAGATLLRNRDFRNPVALGQANVCTDPLNPLAWLMLGVAQENMDLPGAAEESYREALRLVPDFADAHVVYGQLLYRQGHFREAYQQGRHGAETGLGTFGSAYVLMARSALKLGEWQLALAATDHFEAFQRHRYGLYWELRGLALEGAGDDAGALQAYLQEALIEPSRKSDVHRRIGGIQLRQGEIEAAEIAFRRDIERNDSGEGWNGLGVSLALQGKRDSALEAFSRALSLNPGSVEYRRNLEQARREMRRP